MFQSNSIYLTVYIFVSCCGHTYKATWHAAGVSRRHGQAISHSCIVSVGLATGVSLCSRALHALDAPRVQGEHEMEKKSGKAGKNGVGRTDKSADGTGPAEAEVGTAGR